MPKSASVASKEYRERNPERWREQLYKYQKKRWSCPCGSVVSNKCRPAHLRSIRHLEKMAIHNMYKSSSSEDVETDCSV